MITTSKGTIMKRIGKVALQRVITDHS